MLYAQFTHAIGLNDVCDALRANQSALAAIRGAEPPSRNGLSHANRTRDPKMAEALFWVMLEHFETLRPGFGGVKFGRLPRRFKRAVYALDSTTGVPARFCMSDVDVYGTAYGPLSNRKIETGRTIE